ncbi:MAG TPA: sugar ABC transporter ATP-binding protein [Lachnospiraceae bacterium]|nr:sugar ABC transporter ATP-binding protein [Lachnospiraceae bacterium]
MTEWRLEMRNINKSFVSMQALSDVSFLVRPGEAHALLGMNGAGKSTLMKILCGAYTKDSGQILLDGKEIQITCTQDAIDHGIATVYQHPNLVQTFTGYENVFLGAEASKKHLLGRFSRSDLKKKAQELAENYHMPIDVSKSVSEMKPVERELISILHALSHNPRVLILDEPTSILTRKEKNMLFDVINVLKKQQVSIIFVTHRLDEVNEACDELTILRDGKNITSLRIGSGLDTSYIAEMMLGKKLSNLYPPKSDRQDGEVVLKADRLSFNNRVQEVSFEVKKHEILGIYGLVGAGIDELSKLLFGALKRTGGTVCLNGNPVYFRHPAEAIRKGIFLVPGDRKTEGYVGNMDIATNLSLSKTQKICYKALGLINQGRKKKDSLKLIEQLHIATPSEKKNVAELSGGNQQKVVVGKGLYTDADVYIFTEPTVGVDVGARYSIYEIMRDLIQKEAVVLLISSDIEEIYGMSDRILVLNQGKAAFTARADDTTINEILVQAASNLKSEEKGKDIYE